MALVENLHCNIGLFKITTLKGTVNVGMTLNKNGDSKGDTIIFGDEKLPLEEITDIKNAKTPEFTILKPVQP